MTFDQAFDRLLKYEGGYSDQEGDPGGKTRYGITERVARDYGYLGEMKNFPIGYAKRIYKMAYWDAVFADEMPEVVRYALFDAAVHSHPSQAIRWLQRSVGVADDGRLGPVTLAAVKESDGEKILRYMLGHRLSFMTYRKNWADNSRGWARRIASELLA